jgi:hypothetical protein
MTLTKKIRMMTPIISAFTMCSSPAWSVTPDLFNVKLYGAVGDGTTDDTAAINSAITAANANGSGTVWFPDGVYRVIVTSGAHITPKSHVTLLGLGRGQSTILVDDSMGAGSSGIANFVSGSFTALSDFHIKSLTVKGMRETIATTGVHLINIQNGDDISVEDCELTQSRLFGVVISKSNHVAVTGNRVYHTNADGIAVWDDSDVLVSDNDIIGSNDDAISAHSADTTPAPVRSGISIVNNRITESQGISVLGAKNLLISGNVMRRMMSYGIVVDVSPFFTQGETAIIGVKITDNIISDVFARQEDPPRSMAKWYIRVGGGPLVAGSGASAPGTPVPGTGVVTSLYGENSVGNFYTNNITSGGSTPGPGGYSIEVAGNQLIRSLPAVTSYSQWGYGSSLFTGDNATGSYSGPIPEAALNVPGLILAPALRNMRIADNIIQTTGPNAISFEKLPMPGLWHSGDLDGVMIENNKLIDFSGSGVNFDVDNSVQRVTVRNNEFDGDPRFRSADRGAGGSWTAFSGPTAFPVASVTNISGVVWSGNSFRNIVSLFTTAQTGPVAGNILYAQPAVVGASTSNKGIGVIPNDGPDYGFSIEDSDPASATYGRIASPQLSAASAMPTTGTYVTGHFVRNNAPTTGITGMTLFGWTRLTTGGGNVAGTDWQPIYASQTNGWPNLTGPITSSGNVTSVAAQTGTGSTFVMSASPTLASPTANSINLTDATASVKLGGATFVRAPTDPAGYQNLFVGIGAGAGADLVTPLKTMYSCIGYQTCGGAGTGMAPGATNAESTALGWSALSKLTTGSYNTAIGVGSMRNETTGGSNLAVGVDSMGLSVGSNASVALGVNTLKNGSATDSIGIGLGAVNGGASTAVNRVIAIGREAMGGGAIAAAADDIAIGFHALLGSALVSPIQNIAIGDYALSNSTATSPSFNVAIGHNSGASLTGNTNALFGYNSGSHITSGGENVVIGPNVATATLTTGSGNILIGRNSSVDTIAAGTSNQINIGRAIIGYGVAPTVASGYGTAPTVAGNGTFAFKVVVGTGGGTTTPTITLPQAPAGWICSAINESSSATARQSGSSTTSVTISWSAAPAAGNNILYQCAAY